MVVYPAPPLAEGAWRLTQDRYGIVCKAVLSPLSRDMSY